MENKTKPDYPVIALAVRTDDPAAAHGMVHWGIGRLKEELSRRGIAVREVERPELAADGELCLFLSGARAEPMQALMWQSGVVVPDQTESYGLFRASRDGRELLAAAGADAKGLLVALLELAERTKFADDPLRELYGTEVLVEQPTNPIRSVKRLFSNEIEDKPWFHSRQFWVDYLTELATHRFNRLNLALGMGIDNGHDPDLRDNYLCFAYPFFVRVDGYEVRARRLPEAERRLNLSMLRFIGEEARRRGIHFQLALWTHAYQLTGCPDENYPIDGLTADNHAAYCRDALRTLLRACPAIDGVTLRVHYESGIPEPAHEFWRVVMDGFRQAGRQVEIDLHAKGLDDEMIRLALDTGMPVVVSPKYHAEHFALAYHQAAIRPLEMPGSNAPSHNERTITTVSRRHTRYGYADFLKEDRPYRVMYRIFPGTHRLLLWGDPALAAGYGRNGVFCGSDGIEFMEPLTFKARKDSGYPGGRDPYADGSLRFPDGECGEWKKYEYFYRLWGRLLYNPDADAEVWRRYLRHQFGAAAQAAEQALAYASRILPLITVSHLPSAAHNGYWPEMYANMPIAKTAKPAHYGDTPAPKTFNYVSPLDPALFYTIDEYAQDAIQNRRTGKYSPVEVAGRLERLAENAEAQLRQAAAMLQDATNPAFRRFAADAAAQAGIGRFFAWKFRAGVAYAIFDKTGDSAPLRQAISCYRSAKEAWRQVVASTKGIYREDLTFGFKPYMRGHWEDRLAAIEEDIAAMERELADALPLAAAGRETAASYAQALETPAFGRNVTCAHTPPASIARGAAVALALEVAGDAGDLTVRLHYRHANQAKTYRSVELRRDGRRFEGGIPGSYTDSPYPLLYFFELRTGAGDAWIWPGIGEQLADRPYYAVRVELP